MSTRPKVPVPAGVNGCPPRVQLEPLDPAASDPVLESPAPASPLPDPLLLPNPLDPLPLEPEEPTESASPGVLASDPPPAGAFEELEQPAEMLADTSNTASHPFPLSTHC